MLKLFVLVLYSLTHLFLDPTAQDRHFLNKLFHYQTILQSNLLVFKFYFVLKLNRNNPIRL